MIYRGAFHVHSAHSYDGKVPLPQLCDELQRRGFHFVLLTEHDDTLDARAFAKISQECVALSSRLFLAVPGIELRCWRPTGDQWHIAAVGVNTWIDRGPIPGVLHSIRDADGLAVLLHPHKYSKSISAAELDGFNGLEFWNLKEDGRYSPKWKTLRLGAQSASIGIHPYCGIDMHDLDGFGMLALEVECQTLERKLILNQLRKGNFDCRISDLRFGAAAFLAPTSRVRLMAARVGYVNYLAARRIPLVGSLVRGIRRALSPPRI